MIRQRRTGTVGTLLLVTLLFFGVAEQLHAQGLQYTETTQMRLEGMGVVGRALGRVTTETETYVQGSSMRVDEEGDASTITDLDGRRIIMLNHDGKTYSVLTFEQMVEFAEAMSRRAEEGMNEAREEAAQESEGEDVEADFEFEFDSEATGEREEINGYDAEQLLMTLKVNFTVEGEDEEGNQQTARGNFFAVVDNWVTDDIPGYEAVRTFQEEMAQSMNESIGGSGGMMEGLQMAFQQDPRIQASMEKLADEMAKVEGINLRSTTYFVLAPADAELDVDAVLGKKQEEKKRGRLGGIARGALRSRGLPIGGGGNDEASGDAEPAEQRTLLSMTTELKDIRAGAIDQSLFEIPSDYREVEFEGMEMLEEN